MDRATLRSKLMQRVEKHGGHWFWTGQEHSNAELPVFTTNESARQLSWKLYRDTEPPGRLHVTCGELLCIAPDHLRGGTCRRGHEPDRYSDGTCKECRRLDSKRRIACPDCGRVGAAIKQARHRKTCKGAPDQPRQTQHHRSAEERAQMAHDVAADLAAGITPEGICEAYGTTPGGMDAALRRLGRPELARPFQRLDYHLRQVKDS